MENKSFKFLTFVLFSSSFSVQAAVPVIKENNSSLEINVTSFGLIPDDGKDDSLAFENLIGNLDSGNVVFFPSGQYDFNKEIDFSNALPENVTFYGTGKSFIKKINNYADATYFNGGFFWKFKNPVGLTISSLNFTGNKNKSGDIDSALYINGGSNIKIEKSKFSEVDDNCIEISSSEGMANNLIISSNEFYKCRAIQRLDRGSVVSKFNSISVTSNIFVGNSQSVSIESDIFNSGLKVSGNYFFNNTSDAVLVSSYDNVDISNNSFYYGSRAAVNILPFSDNENHTVNSMIFKDNTVIGGRYGFRFKPYDQNVIPMPMVNPMGELIVSNNHFEKLYFDSNSQEPNEIYYQAIRVNNYAKGSIRKIFITGNSFSNQIMSDDGVNVFELGELYNLSMLKEIVADGIGMEDSILHLSNNTTQQNVPQSLQAGSDLPVISSPEFPLSNIFWDVNWDNSFPEEKTYEVLTNKPLEYSIRPVSGQYARKGRFGGEFNLKNFNDFTNNLVKGSYRAEIVGPVSKQDNHERWYSFSSRLAGDYDYSVGAESIFQVHTYPSDGFWERKISTPYALMTNSGRYTFFISGTAEHSPIPNIKKHFIDLGTYDRNVWVDWVFHVKHDSVNGLVEIWKDGIQVVNYQGPVGYHRDSTNHWTYPKWGLYRWSWAEYQHIVSRKVYIDEIKVGSEGANLSIMSSTH